MPHNDDSDDILKFPGKASRADTMREELNAHMRQEYQYERWVRSITPAARLDERRVLAQKALHALVAYKGAWAQHHAQFAKAMEAELKPLNKIIRKEGGKRAQEIHTDDLEAMLNLAIEQLKDELAGRPRIWPEVEAAKPKKASPLQIYSEKHDKKKAKKQRKEFGHFIDLLELMNGHEAIAAYGNVLVAQLRHIDIINKNLEVPRSRF